MAVVAPRVEDLAARVAAAQESLAPSLRALTTSARAGDAAGLADAVAEIRGFAEQERSWLDVRPPDRCSELAYDTYADALGDMGLAAMELEIAMGPVLSGAEQLSSVRTAIERLDQGWAKLLAAQIRAATATCPRPVGSGSQAIVPFTADAYASVAEDLRSRFAVIRAADLKQADYAARLIELEDTALEATSAWRAEGADVSALESAINDVRLMLRQAVIAVSEDEARDSVRLALFGLAEQRSAADTVRAALGLPATDVDDLL